jgi:hypothetical protein
LLLDSLEIQRSGLAENMASTFGQLLIVSFAAAMHGRTESWIPAQLSLLRWPPATYLVFLSQLKIRETHEGDCCMLPKNSQYQIRRPWTSGVTLKTYRCASPTGDSIQIQIWKVDAATIGVLLYTD